MHEETLYLTFVYITNLSFFNLCGGTLGLRPLLAYCTSHG
jgi:hypothetical protein